MQCLVAMFTFLFLICMLIESKTDKWICAKLGRILSALFSASTATTEFARVSFSQFFPSCRHRRTDGNNLTAWTLSCGPIWFYWDGSGLLIVLCCLWKMNVIHPLYYSRVCWVKCLKHSVLDSARMCHQVIFSATFGAVRIPEDAEPTWYMWSDMNSSISDLFYDFYLFSCTKGEVHVSRPSCSCVVPVFPQQCRQDKSTYR